MPIDLRVYHLSYLNKRRQTPFIDSNRFAIMKTQTTSVNNLEIQKSVEYIRARLEARKALNEFRRSKIQEMREAQQARELERKYIEFMTARLEAKRALIEFRTQEIEMIREAQKERESEKRHLLADINAVLVA